MDYSQDFALDPAIIYLNHAAVAPWPKCAAQAIQRFAEENSIRGAQRYPEWAKVEQALRDTLARLLGARSSDEIALLKSTSEGLSVVAYGLDWQSGDNVVIPSQEFPSNRIVWESLARFGVEVRAVDLYSGDNPESALLERIDENTRLLSVSSVQYDTGFRLDLARLGRACENAEVLFCVDAIQSLGALPLNVREIRADFVVADGHKWMLGPEGLAVFYCRRELMDSLKLHQFGWHMVEKAGDFDHRDWTPAKTARRFECGSPNMVGIHGLQASVGFIESVGVALISELVLSNTRYLIENIASFGSRFEIVTTLDTNRHAGIVSFRPRQGAVEPLFQHLNHAGVVCAVRGGAIRLSPHFHTPRNQLDKVLDLLR